MISEDLARLEAEGKPIRVGVSGAGWIGSGFVAQVAHVQGMQVNLLADPDVAAARAAFLAIGVAADDLVETEDPARAEAVLQEGKYVITPSFSLAARLDSVDIVADVTPSPASGAETAFACIQHGKDIVLVNIEADVTVGRILHKKAREAGILYSVSSGDEPGCLMELWDFVTSSTRPPLLTLSPTLLADPTRTLTR
jgi:predicted homoserine dehydrogenase-like protein